MKNTIKERIEKNQNEIKELGAEKLRLEKLKENIVAGLAQIEKVVAQKAGALQELGFLMQSLEPKKEVKKPELVKNDEEPKKA